MEPKVKRGGFMLLLGFLVLVVVTSIVLGILGARDRKARNLSSDRTSVFEICSFGGVIITVIIIGILGIGTVIGYYSQVYDFENIKNIDAVTMILKQKADNLTGEFAGYLAKQYPDLEKEIFKSISPDKVGVYLAAYPQIKSSETVTNLVNMINKLQSDYYDQRLLKEATLRDVRVRLRNPCILTALLPSN